LYGYRPHGLDWLSKGMIQCRDWVWAMLRGTYFRKVKMTNSIAINSD